MKLVKSKAEYDELKKEFSKDIDSFLVKFNNFIRYTSPSWWRTTGHSYGEFLKLKERIDDIEPLTHKDLEDEFVRDEVLSDEEKEFYDKIKKYNL